MSDSCRTVHLSCIGTITEMAKSDGLFALHFQELIVSLKQDDTYSVK